MWWCVCVIMRLIRSNRIERYFLQSVFLEYCRKELFSFFCIVGGTLIPMFLLIKNQKANRETSPWKKCGYKVRRAYYNVLFNSKLISVLKCFLLWIHARNEGSDFAEKIRNPRTARIASFILWIIKESIFLFMYTIFFKQIY